MVTLAKVNEDERSLSFRLGQGLKQFGVPAATAVGGTIADVATLVPRAIQHVSSNIYAGFRGEQPSNDFVVNPITQRLLGGAPPPVAGRGEATAAPVTPATAAPQQQGFRTAGRGALDVGPLPPTPAAAAPQTVEPTAPTTPEFTGIHAQRGPGGFEVPSEFSTTEEARGFRQFREELTRSDRPSVSKVLQRDPETGKYWTQEFMQGSDRDPVNIARAEAAAGIRKDVSQAGLFEAQAEAKPIATEALAGLRSAQAAVAGTAKLLKFTEEVPTGELDELDIPIVRKVQKFFDPTTQTVIDPTSGQGAAPTMATALTAFSELPPEKRSIAQKHFEAKYPNSSAPPGEILSFISAL